MTAGPPFSGFTKNLLVKARFRRKRRSIKTGFLENVPLRRLSVLWVNLKTLRKFKHAQTTIDSSSPFGCIV